MKFQTYIDGLAAAAKAKDKFYARKSALIHEDANATVVDGADDVDAEKQCAELEA